MRRALLALLLGARLAAAHAPHDVIHCVALSPDFERDRTVFAAAGLTDHEIFLRSTDGGRTWDEYGLPMLQAMVMQIVLSPDFATDRTLFAVTARAGVWRSQDGGEHFTPVNTGLPQKPVLKLAISPGFAQDGTLLAASQAGLFRSVDAGASWTACAEGLREAVFAAVAFAPEGGVAYAAGSVLHASPDGGATWKPVQDLPSRALDITVRRALGDDDDGGTPGRVLAIGLRAGGVLVSADGGATLHPRNDAFPESAVNGVAFSADGALFAVTASGNCLRADALRAPWTHVEQGFEPLTPQTEDHFAGVAVSPAFARDRTVWVAAYEGLFHSEDAGALWRQCDIYNQRIGRRAIFSPDYKNDRTLLIANYGGGPLAYVDGVPQPRASGVDSLYLSVLAATPDYANDATLFCSYVGTYRSRDRGLTWTRLKTPFSIGRSLAFSPGFAQDHTLWMGTNAEGLWRSPDAGETWVRADGGLPAEAGCASLAASPLGDGTLWLATSDHGVFVTHDGGAHWAASNEGLPNLRMRTLRVSPNLQVDNTLFLGAQGAGVFISRDAGTTWSAINQGLPTDVPLIVESIAISPAFGVDGAVFVALLDDGVFRSSDAGATWTACSAGLPRTVCRALDVSPDFLDDYSLLLTTHAWSFISRDAGTTWERLPGLIRVDERHPTVETSGGWYPRAAPGWNSAGYAFCETPGCWTRYAFEGRSVAWIGARGPDLGAADVLIDGEPAATVDLGSPVLQPGARLFERDFGGVGWHVIEIRSAGAPEGRDARRVITDGFEVRF
jgi:photosystem II stability/assembly factor-like uncharacterized protein